MAKLIAISLSIFIFAGFKSFGQTDTLKIAENIFRKARLQDSIAFDRYFQRRDVARAIKDSIKLHRIPSTGKSAKPATSTTSKKAPAPRLSLYNADLNLPHGRRDVMKEFVIKMQASQGLKKQEDL